MNGLCISPDSRMLTAAGEMILTSYFSFFLGLRLFECPHDFFLQFMALGCSLA